MFCTNEDASDKIKVSGVLCKYKGEINMSKMIKGVHHIALRPTIETYERTVAFYTDILGLDIVRRWESNGRPKCMISCGDKSFIEILCSEVSDNKETGPLSHLAFHTDFVDEMIEKVRKAGYEITTEPKDFVIESNPPYPARLAFCKGVLGEEIEFFCVKNENNRGQNG